MFQPPGSLVRIGLLIVLCGGVVGSGQPQKPVPPHSIANREHPGKQLVPEGHGGPVFKIAPTQSARLTINLSNDQYVRALIYHSDVEVRIRATKLNGELITEFISHTDGPIPLSFVTRSGDQIQIEVTNNSPKLHAVNSITLGKNRPRAASDFLRLEGERNFREAEVARTGFTGSSLQSAVRLYVQALVRFEDARDDVGAVLTLRSMARAYQALDQREKALDCFYRALKQARRLPDLSSAADISNDLAYLYFAVGQNDSALINAREALRWSRRSRHRDGEATANFLTGESFYGLGDLNKALSYYSEGLTGARESGRYRQQIQMLLALGYSFGELGNIAEARASYDEALGLSLDLEDKRWQAITLRALGNLQTNLGEKQQALDSLHKSWTLIQEFNDSPSKGAILGALGYIYATAGEYRTALEYYSQTRTLFTKMGHHWGAAELEMEVGNIHILLREPEVALGYFEKALQSFRSLQMVRYEAQTLKNMGLAQEMLGNSEKAIAYLNRSVRLNRADQDQRYHAYTLNYLGRVYHNSKDYLGALQYYEKALRLSQIGADPFGQSQTLYNRAAAYLALGQLAKALSDSKQSLSIIESLRTKVASQYLRSSYLASVHQHYELQISILMALSEKHSSQTFAAEAFEASEQARARSLVESLSETHANIRQGVDPALLAREQELERQLNSTATRQLRILNGGEEAAALNDEIRKLSVEHDEVQGLIRAKSPRYAAVTQTRPISVNEIQQILDDDSLLLEYALGEERSFVWAVTRENVWGYQLPGRARIETAAQDVYRLLTANQSLSGESFATWKGRTAKAESELSGQLFNLSSMLLEPVAAHLNRKYLLIVSDGALQYIPFQVLTKPMKCSESTDMATAERCSLVTEHVIINEPSASALALLLAENTNRLPAENAVAVLADPVFETSDPRLNSAVKTANLESGADREVHRALRDVGVSNDGVGIPRLPSSRDEANAIISAAPWWSTFQAMGFAATRETAMKPELADYRIVHFATHGLLNNEHPELSGIVLSLVDQQGQPQDGFLRLHDIYNLKLPVELVVLSACNTGLGKDVRGEGLIGLTRGFMYAGASSVVASLWKVDDEATAELMRHFYKFMLQDNLSPPAALRAAQLQMRKEKRWQSPYYWSGFIIQGQYVQPEPVYRFHLKSGAVLVVLSAVLMAAMILLIRRRRKNFF